MKTLLRKPAFFFFIVLALLISGCAKEKTITIISTNDMHAAIDNFPKLATLVKQYRAADSAHLLLLDAGDRWTGNPYVDMADKQCYPIIELMSKLGYNAATLGNHEFDHGQTLLQERMDQSGFPYLVANMLSSDSALMRQTNPYMIVDVDGVKVSILGLVTNQPNGHPIGKEEHFKGLTFPDPDKTLLEYGSLRDQSDVMVALTHTGIEIDTVLAARMPELDLIVGGHSHTTLGDGGRKIGNVLVTQTGSRLKYAGVTTITLKGKKIESIVNKLVLLDTIPADPGYAAMVAAYKDTPKLKAIVGNAREQISKQMLAGIFGDVIREGTGSAFAFYNWNGVRTNGIKAGDISVADVYAMEPFGSEVYTLEMTEDQIKEFIMNKFNSTDSEGHYLDLIPSGLEYTVLTDAAGDAVDVVLKHKALSRTGKYKVALSDYVQGNYNYSLRGKAVPTSIQVTDLLIEYFGKHPALKDDKTVRAKIEKSDAQSVPAPAKAA